MTAPPYYQDDYVTIINGDAWEILPTLAEQSYDVVITDPPYDERTHSMARSNSTKNSVSGKGSRVLSGGSNVRFEAVDHEQQVHLFAMLGKITRGWVVSNVALDTAFRFQVEGPPPGLRLLRVGAWVKTNPMPQISADRPAQGWESIAYLRREELKPAWNGGGRAGNFVLPSEQGTGHPTAKPLGMAASWVRWFTLPGDVILDPFAGTGTTGRAAKDEGRRAVLIEDSERWCEYAAKRMEPETLWSRPRTVEPDAPLFDIEAPA